MSLISKKIFFILLPIIFFGSLLLYGNVQAEESQRLDVPCGCINLQDKTAICTPPQMTTIEIRYPSGASYSRMEIQYWEAYEFGCQYLNNSTRQCDYLVAYTLENAIANTGNAAPDEKAIRQCESTARYLIRELGASTWCMTPEKECMQGTGSPCPGTEYASEAECKAALPKWCLTAEKTCVAGTGGPCSGTEYSSKEECTRAVSSEQDKSTYSCVPPECTPLQNPLGDVKALPVVFGNVIKAVTGVMGSIALLVFIYGGVMWIFSGGNAERVKKGTQAMLWAAIGIIVVFSSYAIITLIIQGMGAL